MSQAENKGWVMKSNIRLAKTTVSGSLGLIITIVRELLGHLNAFINSKERTAFNPGLSKIFDLKVVAQSVSRMMACIFPWIVYWIFPKIKAVYIRLSDARRGNCCVSISGDWKLPSSPCKLAQVRKQRQQLKTHLATTLREVQSVGKATGAVVG